MTDGRESVKDESESTFKNRLHNGKLYVIYSRYLQTLCINETGQSPQVDLLPKIEILST